MSYILNLKKGSYSSFFITISLLRKCTDTWCIANFYNLTYINKPKLRPVLSPLIITY